MSDDAQDPQVTFGQALNFSETGLTYMVVNALADDDNQLQTVIDLFHLPTPAGAPQPVAYLVYGVPGTTQFSMMDLNKLPDNLKVTVEVVQTSGPDGTGTETCMSKSVFVGKRGNTQQPAEPPRAAGN